MSPALFSIDFSFIGLGRFHLRWYALGYMAGIGLAWWYAAAMLKRPALFGGESPLTKDQLDDIMFWIILGIILGGRLGYILFYMVPYQFDALMADPGTILRIWDGGMSFHGGSQVSPSHWPISPGREKSACSPSATLPALWHRSASAWCGSPTSPMPNSMAATRTRRGAWCSRKVSCRAPPAYNWDTGKWVYNGFETARYPSQLYESALKAGCRLSSSPS